MRLWKRGRPALVALAVLLTAAPAAPLPAGAAARVPALAGVTVVKGSSPAGMRVRIPRPVTIDRKNGVGIVGDGRLVALVITRENVSQSSRESFEAIRFGYCDGAGCSPEKTSKQYLYSRGGSGGDTHGKITLTPGEYLLYLVADGAPAKVTVRLQGLAGTKVLRPRTPARSGFAVPTADNSTTSPGDDAFWWGEEIDIEGDAGYVLAILRMDVDNWVDLHYGDCAYLTNAPPPRPLAYSPPCPGGIAIFTNESSDVPASHSFEVPMFVEVNGPGHLGYGLFYTGAADVSNRFTLFFHMDLDVSAL